MSLYKDLSERHSPEVADSLDRLHWHYMAGEGVWDPIRYIEGDHPPAVLRRYELWQRRGLVDLYTQDDWSDNGEHVRAARLTRAGRKLCVRMVGDE